MGGGDDFGSALGAGVGLLMGVAVTGAVLKGVSNMAEGLNRRGSFEGVKPAKIKAYKAPKVPVVKHVKVGHSITSGKVPTVPKTKEDYFSPAAMMKRQKSFGQI